jgi:hypothetical protein
MSIDNSGIENNSAQSKSPNVKDDLVLSMRENRYSNRNMDGQFRHTRKRKVSICIPLKAISLEAYCRSTCRDHTRRLPVPMMISGSREGRRPNPQTMLRKGLLMKGGRPRKINRK